MVRVSDIPQPSRLVVTTDCEHLPVRTKYDALHDACRPIEPGKRYWSQRIPDILYLTASIDSANHQGIATGAQRSGTGRSPGSCHVCHRGTKGDRLPGIRDVPESCCVVLACHGEDVATCAEGRAEYGRSRPADQWPRDFPYPGNAVRGARGDGVAVAQEPYRRDWCGVWESDRYLPGC